MNTRTTARNQKLERLVRIASLILVFLGGTPVLIRFVGVPFVPSPSWVSSVFWPACVVGAISGAIALWAVHLSLTDGVQNSDPLKTVLAILFLPLVGFAAGNLIITATIPLLVSIPSSKPVEVTFVVGDPNMGDYRRCPRPISLQDTAPAVNMVCDVPDSVRRRLRTGRTVVLVGVGSKLGVFPRDFRLP